MVGISVGNCLAWAVRWVVIAASCGVSAAAAHAAEVVVRHSETARTIYLDSGKVRVGVDKRWGGAIREIRYRGRNLVNNHDGGRLIGVSLYDGDRLPVPGAPGDTGWNPTPSDIHDAANPPVATSFAGNVLYVKTRQLQWYPDNKGGGARRPLSTEVLVETWIEFLDATTIHVRYRYTNAGRDGHGTANQEFPFAYVRRPFDRFIAYTGGAPWTMAAPETRTVALAHDVSAQVPEPEYWGGFVDKHDVGLILYTPQSYPELTYSAFTNKSGNRENPTFYLLPRSLFGIEPGEVRETNVYIFAGKWQDARRRIYALRRSLALPDVMPGFGTLETRPAGTRVSGTIPVNGWALDDRGVKGVEIALDGNVVGRATYGGARPDVVRDYPVLPGAPGYGFNYALDTARFANGKHRLAVRVVDTAGNRGRLVNGDFDVEIAN